MQLRYLLSDEQIRYFELSKDKFKLDNLISEIKTKVNLYKIENSHILLKDSKYFDENFTYIKKNQSLTFKINSIINTRYVERIGD